MNEKAKKYLIANKLTGMEAYKIKAIIEIKKENREKNQKNTCKKHKDYVK